MSAATIASDKQPIDINSGSSEIPFTPIPYLYKIAINYKSCIYRIGPLQQFADILPFLKPNINSNPEDPHYLEESVRFAKNGVATCLQHYLKNLLYKEEKLHTTNYIDNWLIHTLISHRDECIAREQGKTVQEYDSYILQSDYDFFSKKNSTTYVQIYTFRNQKWIAINMGIRLNFEYDLEPVYAYFCEPTDDEKKQFGWLNVSGKKVYIYPGVNWNPRFILKGFSSKKNAPLSNFAVPMVFPKRAPFKGCEEYFDPRIKMHYNHHAIFKDNETLITEVYKNAGIEVPLNYTSLLKKAIDRTIIISKEGLMARLQCYFDKHLKKEILQFLLPLYLLGNFKKCDLVLTVNLKQVKMNDKAIKDHDEGIQDPINYIYWARTVIKPELAYMNARLLGQVHETWLL
jgi:hypothetical protein